MGLKKKSGGAINVSMMNVHLAKDPVLFMNQDPNKHKCIFPVILNRGVDETTGEERRDDVTVCTWGAYALESAWWLKKGSRINIVDGTIRTFNKPTGRTLESGKAEYEHRVEVSCNRWVFGGDTFKELVETINANIAILKSQGQLPPNTTITAEQLLAKNRTPRQELNLQVVAQTGKYGNARVYQKNVGWVGPQNTAPAIQAANWQNPVDNMTKEGAIAYLASMGLQAIPVAQAAPIQAAPAPAPVQAQMAAAGQSSIDPFNRAS